MFWLSHNEIKKIINLVRHEMQAIGPKLTDLNVEEKVLLVSWHDQNNSGFFGVPLLSSQLQQFEKFSKSPALMEKKPALQKSHFCFDHVNRLFVSEKAWQWKLLKLQQNFLKLTQSNLLTISKVLSQFVNAI